MPERGTQAQPGEGRPDPGLPGPRPSGPAQPNQGQSGPGPKAPKVSDSAQKSPAFSSPDQQSSVRAESDPQSLHGSDSVQQSPADSCPDLGTPVRRSPSQQSPVGSDPIQQSRVRTDSVNQAPTCSDLFSSGGPAPSTDPAQLLLTGPRPCHRGGRCRELLSTLFIWGIALFVTSVFSGNAVELGVRIASLIPLILTFYRWKNFGLSIFAAVLSYYLLNLAV